MRNPIAKLAAAAAILVAIGLGVFAFISIGSHSGVAWAKVAERTKASEGVIYRNRVTHSTLGEGGPDYAISYLSATRSRQDAYKANEVIQSIYCDFDGDTVVWIEHKTRRYMTQAMNEQTRREQHGAWANPGRWVEEFLSRDYTNLGQKVIEGVQCEGIEITDPSFGAATFAVDKLVARVWVSAETGYPVLLEGEMTGGNGALHIAGVLDQFQWDVELDESLFEANVPADYQEM